MIGIKDKWCASINGDDIKPDEFKALNIEETSDLGLPTCNFTFHSHDLDKVRRYTKRGEVIPIGIGDWTMDILVENEFKVQNKKIATFQGNDNWSVNLSCILNKPDYYHKHRMRTFNTWGDKWRSSDVIAKVWQDVGLIPKVHSSKDKMLWLQANVSDRRFLEEVVHHAWYGEGKPVAYGIKKNDEAFYQPFETLLSPKFTIGNMEGVDIPIEGWGIQVNDGFASGWMGYDRINPTHRTEDGYDIEYNTKVTPVIAPDAGMYSNEKFAPVRTYNDNVHKEWVKAESQNLQFRASLSANSMMCTLHGEYKDISVGDCLDGRWITTDKIDRPHVEVNGLWIVSKVRHLISEGSYNLEVFLSREALIEDAPYIRYGGR